MGQYELVNLSLRNQNTNFHFLAMGLMKQLVQFNDSVLELLGQEIIPIAQQIIDNFIQGLKFLFTFHKCTNGGLSMSFESGNVHLSSFCSFIKKPGKNFLPGFEQFITTQYPLGQDQIIGGGMLPGETSSLSRVCLAVFPE